MIIALAIAGSFLVNHDRPAPYERVRRILFVTIGMACGYLLGVQP